MARIVVLGLLLLALFVYVWRAPLRHALARLVSSRLSHSLPGSTVQIGALRGSLFTSLELRDVVLRQHTPPFGPPSMAMRTPRRGVPTDRAGSPNAPLMRFDAVHLRYNLWSLLTGQLTIRSVVVIRPRLRLLQDASMEMRTPRRGVPTDRAGSPNAPLMPAKGAPASQPYSAWPVLPVAIILQDLQIHDAQVELEVPSLPGVQRLTDVQVRLHGHLDAAGAFRLELEQLRARLLPAGLAIQTLGGALEGRPGHLRLVDLRLQTEASWLSADGVLPGGDLTAALQLNLHPLDLTEVGQVLQRHAMRGALHLSLSATGPADALEVRTQLFPSSEGCPSPLQRGAPGGGGGWGRVCRLGDGRLDLVSWLNTTATPMRYRAKLDLARFDLATLTGGAALRSDLNMHLLIDGEGFRPQDQRGRVQLEVRPSRLRSMAIHASQIELHAQATRFQVRRFHLHTSVGDMQVSGALDLAGDADLRYRLTADLTPLRPLLDTEVRGSVQMQGRVYGALEAIEANGTLQASDLQYNDVRLADMRLTYEGHDLGTSPRVTAHLMAQHGQIGTLQVARMVTEATYQESASEVRFTTEMQLGSGPTPRPLRGQPSKEGKGRADASARRPYQGRARSPNAPSSLVAALSGTLSLPRRFFPPRSLRFPSFRGLPEGRGVLDHVHLQLADRVWRADAPVDLRFSPKRLEVKGLRLRHAKQVVELSGGINGQRFDQVRLHLTGFDLTDLGRLVQLPAWLRGQAEAQVRLSGTLTQPMLHSTLTWQPHIPASLPPMRLHTTLSYEQKRLQAKLRLQQGSREVLRLTGDLPIDLAFTALPMQQRALVTPLALRVDLKKPHLAVLQHWFPTIPVLSGSVQGQVAMRGTSAALQIDTQLDLQALRIDGLVERLSAPLQLRAVLAVAEARSALVTAWSTQTLLPHLRELELRLPQAQVQFAAQAFAEPDRKRPGTSGRHSDVASGVGPTSSLPARARSPNAPLLQIDEFLMQAEARLTRAGWLATLHSLRLQARGWALPRMSLEVAARLTPQDLELTRFVARSSESELRGHGRMTTADRHLQFRFDLPRLRLDEFAVSWPAAQGGYLCPVPGSAANSPLQRAAPEGGGVWAASYLLPQSAQGVIDVQGTLQKPRLKARLWGGTAEMTADVQAQMQDRLPTYAATVRLEVPQVAALLPQAQGRLLALLQLQGKGLTAPKRQAHVDLTITSEGLTLLPGLRVQGQATVHGNAVQLERLRLRSAVAQFEAHGRLAATRQVAATYALTLTDLRPLQPILGLPWLAMGSIDGAVKGKLGKPQATLQARLTHIHGPGLPSSALRLDAEGGAQQAMFDLVVTAGPYAHTRLAGHVVRQDGGVRVTLEHLRLQHLDRVWERVQPVNLVYHRQGTLQVSDLRLRSGSQELLVRGRLTAAGASAQAAAAAPSQTLDLELQVSALELSGLAAWVPAVRHMDGAVNGTLRLTGPLQQPQAHGVLRLDQGSLELVQTGQRYHAIRMRLDFNGNTLTLTQFQVHSENGILRLTGWLGYTGWSLQQLDLHVRADDFTLMRTPMMEAVIDSALRLRGSLQELTATGRITVSHAQVRLTTHKLGGGPAAVQPWELTVAGVFGPGASSPTDDVAGGARRRRRPAVILPFLQADVAISLPRNVWLQGPGTTVELHGQMQVTKALQQPFVLHGILETVRGFVTTYGKKFTLQNGQVIFPGSEQVNPVLDVTATYKVSDYVVTIEVTGKVQKPAIRLSSTPALEQADVVSLLVIGRTTERLSASERQAFVGSAQRILGGVAAGQLQNILAQPLGVDTLVVESGGTLESSKIGGGRYVTQDLFLSYERQMVSKGGNTIGVEYSINRHLKLKSSASDTGETALELIWSLDY